MRRLRVSDDVASLTRGLHPDLKRKIRSALDDVLADPTVGKTLRDELAGLRSCRIFRFRIG
jgi:mRNA interferase RelE/StbE